MKQLNNRYKILKSLARGGFGETFLAIDTHLPSSRQCVIKQLKPAIESPVIPDWLKERFQREAAILESLGEHNPQIPQLYAYFSENNHFYLVQEWIDGLTLTQLVAQKGTLSSQQTQEILVKLLPVLAYIHKERIIHRDIKPDNIIIRHSDQLPILIDFGIMKEAIATYVDPQGKTAYSVALGTPGYMASEQAAGRPVYSSDLYSLGLTGIFLLTGQSPQYLDNDDQTGEIIWQNQVKTLSPSLATVLDQVIRFHPRDRYSSAKQMLAALTSTMPSMQPATAATEVVAPPSSYTTDVTDIRDKEQFSRPNPVWNWLVLPLLLAGLSIGSFIIAFSLFFPRNPDSNSPQPLESPPPQTFPTPDNSPTPRDTPNIPPTPTPTPEATPTPTPVTPVETPSPLPINPPIPTPEAAPIPTPKPTITPLYPEPIIPPGAELTPLTPIPDLPPPPAREVMPNPLSPSPIPPDSPPNEEISIPVVPPETEPEN
ncbi:MAG: protein kinase [Microcystaceae cyanobacterium]